MDSGRLPGLIARLANRLRHPIDSGAEDCPRSPIEALSNTPSRFSIGHSSSDATHSTPRACISTATDAGAWIRQRHNRDKVVVVSKGCRRRLLLRHPRLLLRLMCRTTSTHRSRRSAPITGLYLLHFDHPTARIEPVMERLTRHIDEGKISTIGASNWSHERIPVPTRLPQQGLKPFSASSVQFSLAEWTRSPWPGAVTLGRDAQRTAREWYLTHQLP